MPGEKKNSGRGQRDLKTNVKSARGKTVSQVKWLQRQLNDPYVKRAKLEGFRGRAAYKIMELDDKFNFLKPGSRVIDLGCAPGGWCQVVSSRVNVLGNQKDKDIGEVIGIDLQEVFQEVMNAGDDAGIDILIGSVTSGSTTIVFEQYDGPMKTLTVDGVQTDFSTKVTELTVRHGLLDDFAIHSEWSDSFGGIDLTIGYDSEQLFNADVVYTEYFDADMGLHGMDMEMDIMKHGHVHHIFVGCVSKLRGRGAGSTRHSEC